VLYGNSDGKVGRNSWPRYKGPIAKRQEERDRKREGGKEKKRKREKEGE